MMLPKRTIAVDLCNTVCDINGLLEKKLSTVRKRGVYHIDGVTPSFFSEHVEVFREAKPFPYAAETLWLLSRYYEIVYLTARPEVAHDATLDFLFKNGFPMGQVIFSQEKATVFKQMSMAFAIDDAPHEVMSYMQAEIPVLIKAWDYNEHMGPRFEWVELYRCLVEQIENQRYADFFCFQYFQGGV